MRKKKEIKILNIGEEFKENKKLEKGYYTEFKTLRNCYTSWSNRKEYIYNYYKKLLTENSKHVINYGIRSYNANVIILHAEIEKNNKKYYLVITPTYKWYKELEEV